MSTQENIECALLRASSESAADERNFDASTNRITSVDRAVIAQYFDGRRSLASVAQSARQPKLRRRRMIGGKLPATLRTDALPCQLESRLSRLQPGYARLHVGCDVLCVELASSRIADVMHNAGPPETQDTVQLLTDGGVNRAATSPGRL